MAFLNNARGKLKKLVLDFVPEPLLTPMRKVHYARVLKSVSVEDDSDFWVIKQLVGEGDRVVDLGAHVGICTKYLSDLVGASGRVYSVEPFPLTFDILRSNVKKLALRNVEIINCAVSDKPGTVTMEVPRFAELGESFYDARIIPGEAKTSLRQALVEAKTVDSLFPPGSSPIRFIKCDVEGQELETLHGATELIQRDGPAWLIEISLMEGSTRKKLLGFLRAEGYFDLWFDGVKLKRLEQNDKPVNAFFLKQEHIAAPGLAGLVASA